MTLLIFLGVHNRGAMVTGDGERNLFSSSLDLIFVLPCFFVVALTILNFPTNSESVIKKNLLSLCYLSTSACIDDVDSTN